jgi:peptide-methionine (R)-S-oxide reductase
MREQHDSSEAAPGDVEHGLHDEMPRRLWVKLLAALGMGAIARAASAGRPEPMVLSEAEWKQRLTPEQYDVLRSAGTERARSSALNAEKRAGIYRCAGCDLALFSSHTKFESGTGWPSFYQPLENAVGKTEDRTFGMLRTEIHCRRCGGHLGHVFDDGPKPTGLRYCMDGFALVFHPAGPTAS